MAKKRKSKELKYAPAVPQSKHSGAAVARALYWIESQADEVKRGRQTLCHFQGNYNAILNMNLPIVCRDMGKDSAGKNIFDCFEHPPLDVPAPKRGALRLETYRPRSKRHRTKADSLLP